MRADFYAHCAQFDNLREALAKRQEYIGPMSAEELRRAIEEPARRNGWEFEPGLVDLLLRDVGDEPGALPLLSHALLETWKRRRGRTLTLEGYHESGGVRGAIAKTAETVFNQLKPEQQAIARSIFLRLTELGEGTQDTRRRATLSELMPRPEDKPAVETVLKTLADARLVTTEKETAEVAHEALIREWPTLRKWLDEDREGLRIHRQLTEDAQEWVELNRDLGALYRGARLAQALEWRDRKEGALNELEREFLERSVLLKALEAEEKRERQERELALERQARRRLQALVIVLGLIVLAGAGVLARQEFFRQTARAAGALRLVPGRNIAFESYEVINHRYGGCVAAGPCSPPPPQLSTYFRPDADQLPVTGVDALQAAEFCRWIGRRLPTLDEWEHVATQGRRFGWPWGDDPFTPVLANLDTDGTGQPEAVGSRKQGASPEGIYDLIGNVWEWTATPWNELGPAENAWDEQPSSAPNDLTIVGGGYQTSISGLDPTSAQVSYRAEDIGFRCVEGGGS